VGASWFPVQERATAAGIPVLAQFVGIIIAMALTPLLTNPHGITGMLLLYGVVSGAIALLFCVFMKEKPPTPPAREGTVEHFRFFEGIRDLFKNRDVLFMIIFIILSFTNLFIYTRLKESEMIRQ